MGQETDNLLESDRIEDVLEGYRERIEDVPEGIAPAAPVVVVQSRSRTLPWVLIVGGIVVVAVGSGYAYHRREVARLSRQREMAIRDLERARQKAREEENELRIKSLPPPLAAAPAVTVAELAAGAGASSLPQVPPAPAPAAPPPPVVDANRPDPKPAGPPRPRVLAQVIGDPDPAPAPAGALTPTGPTGNPAPLASADPAGPSPFDELDPGAAAGGPNQVDHATAPASAPAAAGAKPGDAAVAEAAKPAGPPAEPPLPSREETERQLRAEAAALQQEGARRLGQQQEELQALRNDERRQFLDELRMILQVHGRQAGPEIQRLYNRSGRTDDPRLLMPRRLVITEGRADQRTKVRKLRELGVPETVIMDYLANRLDKSVGKRYGLRNRNEVWNHVADLMVKYYDLDVLRAAAPRPGQGQAAVPAGRPAGDAPPPR